MTLPPMNNDTQTDKNGRVTSPAHRLWVRKHKCIAHHLGNCQGPIDCAHARDVAPRTGKKPSDIFCVSLCRFKHHRDSEKREEAWGKETGIDVLVLAMEFAAASPDRRIKQAAMEYMKAEKAKRVKP